MRRVYGAESVGASGKQDGCVLLFSLLCILIHLALDCLSFLSAKPLCSTLTWRRTHPPHLRARAPPPQRNPPGDRHHRATRSLQASVPWLTTQVRHRGANATLGAGPGPSPPEVQYFSGGCGLHRGQRRTCQQLKTCHPAVAARPPSLYGTTTPPLRRRTYHCCHTVPERPKPGIVAERLSYRRRTVPLRLRT